MAFEAIQEYLDKIEELLSKGQSPQAIANALKIPKKAKTISRYKREVFDIQGAARDAWEGERAKTTEDRFAEGKARIVDSLEVLNLAKLRAFQLLDLELDDKYKTADGQEKKLSLGSAAIYWETGSRIAVQAIRQEQEIAGDDPESRKADALEGLGESELRELHKLLVARRDELGSEAD